MNQPELKTTPVKIKKATPSPKKTLDYLSAKKKSNVSNLLIKKMIIPKKAAFFHVKLQF